MVASRSVILAAAVCALDAAAAFAPPTLPTSVRALSQRAPSALALRARGADEDAAPAAAVPRRAALRHVVLAGGTMLLMPHQAAVAETEMKEKKKSKKQMDEEYEEDLSGQRKVGRRHAQIAAPRGGALGDPIQGQLRLRRALCAGALRAAADKARCRAVRAKDRQDQACARRSPGWL